MTAGEGAVKAGEGAVKRVPRGVIAWLVVVAAALVVHAICGRVLAGRDLIAAVIGGRDLWMVLVAGVLVLCRLFLFLLAPGWAIHVAARTLLERRAIPAGPAARGRGTDAPGTDAPATDASAPGASATDATGRG